jgi:hypothetical protein
MKKIIEILLCLAITFAVLILVLDVVSYFFNDTDPQEYEIVQHGVISPDYMVIGTSDSYSPMENNLMIGEYAGWNFIKGSCNLFLGKDSGVGVMESNNKIYLESGTYDITCEEVKLLLKVLADDF